MPYALLSVLLQASAIVSPAPAGHENEAKRIVAFLTQKSTRHGTVTKPTLVAAGQIPSPERLIVQHRKIEAEASGMAARSVVPSLRAELGSECTKLSEFPRGFRLAGEPVLNGRSTLYRCGSFVAEVIAEDVSHPLEGITGKGFGQADVDAYVNGGALSRIFRRSADGVKQLAGIWIGDTTSYTVELTARDADFLDLQVQGDRILNLLTADHPRSPRR